ncbi:hypothetical protein E2C01_000705 [Portunus trituberculatus]|uniref:Uncharacterized protein n=1 Tax=Portunus trituberculatus TaxID=210409 RepID=A0A5B7CF28_PORTR|nr:hypothetical protein [Portunus trituberculatus]
MSIKSLDPEGIIQDMQHQVRMWNMKSVAKFSNCNMTCDVAMTKYITAMAAVVSSAGDAELFLTEATVAGFLVWCPLSVTEGLAHIPQVGHLQLGL